MKCRTLHVGDLVDEGVASIQTGPFGTQLKASDYVADGTPVINVRNVGYGDLRPEKLEYVNEDTAVRLDSHLLEPGDIVFGRKGAVDRHLLASTDHKGWMQGSDCIRLRFSSPEVVPRFVSFVFLSPQHKDWMLSQAGNKATMASLNQDIVRRIPLPLPPLHTQSRIVSLLSTYDGLIENNRRRMVLLEEAARLLYREWFVLLRFPGHEHTRIGQSALGRIPSDWRVAPLGEIATKIGSGATPKGGEAAYRDAGVTLIRSMNVYDSGFSDDGLAYLDDDQAEGLANVTVEPRDILLNITGASVARCCMVPDRHLPARVNQHVMIIRADPSRCDPYFLLASINSQQRKQQLLSYAQAGGATREALTKEAVSNFQIVLPSPTLVAEFGRFARELALQREVLAKQNQKLRAARDLLLPRLMSGEIVV